MDIKSYILIGGGALLVIVLLHGLWSAIRSRPDRPRKSDADTVTPAEPLIEESARTSEEEGTQDAGLWDGEEVTAAPPVLMERVQDAAPPSPTEEVTMPTEEEPPAEEEAPPVDNPSPGDAAMEDASEDTPDPSAPRSRIIVAGTRTEPTIPRAQRLADPNWMARSPLTNGATPAEEVIVIWIVANADEVFDGDALLETFLSNGLECGADRVFRKFDPRTDGPWFTVANGIEPGSFDVSDSSTLATPCVVMLMPLPGVRDPAGALDDMLEVAQDMAITLGGALKDEGRSAMSAQTIEHYRQRVREFKRKALRA